MHTEILNITNGEYFNEYFISKFGGRAVPFCEAIMDGEVLSDIYSEEFIAVRSKSLNITKNEYKAKMYAYDALNNNDYKRICLWFGKDTFCQVNLLMLLAYLEQIRYEGELKLNYIDDETFEVLESDVNVELGGYNKIYEQVLISKNLPSDVGVLYSRAINLYFDYHSDTGTLAEIVKANAHKDRMEIVGLLLEESKDYGLSDLQAEGLINRIR